MTFIAYVMAMDASALAGFFFTAKGAFHHFICFQIFKGGLAYHTLFFHGVFVSRIVIFYGDYITGRGLWE